MQKGGEIQVGKIILRSFFRIGDMGNKARAFDLGREQLHVFYSNELF